MTARTFLGMAGACAVLGVACGTDDRLVGIPGDDGVVVVSEPVTPGSGKASAAAGGETPPNPRLVETSGAASKPASKCPDDPGPRDCASPADNDCDGRPDNTIDEVCRCKPDARESCNEHEGKDDKGPCRAGQRVCEASASGTSSDWGPCTGDVAPKAQDNCSVEGDDSDCDGTPNSPPCICISGDTQNCGPAVEQGICQFGTSTCVNNRYGSCQGAVTARARNCASSEDNNCDGKPDDTVDASCTCRVGTSIPCGTHSDDGVGVCRAGTQTCVASASGSTSAYGACTGSVGPSASNCSSSRDNDCDGTPDSALNGTECRASGRGICAEGSLECSGGSLRCVAAAPRTEVCNGVDDDCDGEVDETCITVLQARIGCLDIQIDGNLTGIVGQACDGRTTCSYQAPTPEEYGALGVEARTRSFCTQAMEITYRCGDTVPPVVFVPGDAWNNPPAQLSCASF